jgi:hypothetical protein
MKKYDEFLNERKLALMTPQELRKRVVNNFTPTPERIEELVDVTKDYTTGEQLSIMYALGVNDKLYSELMLSKYHDNGLF